MRIPQSWEILFRRRHRRRRRHSDMLAPNNLSSCLATKKLCWNFSHQQKNLEILLKWNFQLKWKNGFGCGGDGDIMVGMDALLRRGAGFKSICIL